MDVERVLATNCVLASGNRCWNKKNDEGMQRVWKFTTARRVSWKTCRGPGSLVRLQLEDFGMKCPRYDRTALPDNRNMNPHRNAPRRCQGDVDHWVKGEVSKKLSRKTRRLRVKDRLIGRTTQSGLVKKRPLTSGYRSTNRCLSRGWPVELGHTKKATDGFGE